MPTTVNDMLICYIVGCAVAAVGAFVGGVVALLMKWASAGASVGTLIALWLILVDDGTFVTNETRIAAVFGTCLAVGMAVSWHKEEVKSPATIYHLLQCCCYATSDNLHVIVY
jgi:hypothetical protein